jgi:hypothetical protein
VKQVVDVYFFIFFDIQEEHIVKGGNYSDVLLLVEDGVDWLAV